MLPFIAVKDKNEREQIFARDLQQLNQPPIFLFVQIIYSENFVSEKYIHIKKKEHNCSLALVTLVRCLIAKNYMRTLICVKKSYFI
jgi:hypothetical protein